ncbi:Cell-division control histidine kinase PdhS [Clostridium sp. C105KSO13]|nr:Cell-division control histidine kinase PdhS [Clostridium sp. C105KSO13]
MNILDIAENSIRAGASLIEIEVSVMSSGDTLTVVIKDNGCGMSSEQTEKVQDPFYTTRITRRVGLGIPFFKQAAESTKGTFSIVSKPGKGTIVRAVFKLSHIDRMPLGDITATIYTLVVFNERIHFIYTYRYNENEFVLDTREIREILGEGVSFSNPEVSAFIKEYLISGKEETDQGNDI